MAGSPGSRAKGGGRVWSCALLSGFRVVKGVGLQGIRFMRN